LSTTIIVNGNHVWQYFCFWSNKCSLGEHKRLLSETIVTLLLYDFYKCGCFLQVYFTFGYKFAPKIWLSMHTDSHLHFALWLTLSISLFSIMKAGLYFI